MHHNYSRVQHILPMKTTYQPSNRQPKIDPYWHDREQKVEQKNKTERIEVTEENVETAPEQKTQKVTLEQRIGSNVQYAGLEKLDYTKSTTSSRNKLDDQVDVQIHDKLSPMEDPIQIHDKLAPMDDKIQIHDKIDKLDTSSSNIQETKLDYTPSTGISNLPPLQNEFEVFGFHYPPRDYEVYPFKKQPKPYSNMAFDKCPKMVTGQLVFYWSCSQYLNCYKGRGYIANCAPGTLFNPESLECDFPEKVTCISGTHNQKVKSEKLIAETNEGVICQPNYSGLLAHPSDCTKFLNCVSGQTYVQTCGPGTVFNPKISTCDHPYNTDCDIEVNTQLPYVRENDFDMRSNIKREHGPNPTLPTLKEVQRNYSSARSNYDLIVGQTQHYGSYQDGSRPGRQFHVYSSQMSPTSYDQKQQPPQSSWSSSSSNTGQVSSTQFGQNSGCQQSSGCNKQGSNQETSNYGRGQVRYNQNTECQQNSGCNNQNINQGATNYDRTQIQYNQNSGCPPGYNCNIQNPNQGTHNYDKITTQSSGVRPNCIQTHDSLVAVSSTQSRRQTSSNFHASAVEDSARVKCPPGQTGLVPHPFICEKFLNCANGRTFVQDCGPGTVFNPNIQACDWPANVNCKTQPRGQQFSNYQNKNEQSGREIEFATDQRGSASQQHSTFTNVGGNECKDGFYPQSHGVVSNPNGFRGAIGHRRDFADQQGQVSQPIPTWIPSYGGPTTPRITYKQPRPHVVYPSPSVPTYVYTTYPGVPYPPSSGQHIPQYIPQRPPPMHTTPRVTYSMSSSVSTHQQNRPQYYPNLTPKPHTTYSVPNSGGNIPVFTNGHSAGHGQQKIPFDFGTGTRHPNVHLNVGTGQQNYNIHAQHPPIETPDDYGQQKVPIFYGTGQPNLPIDSTSQQKVPVFQGTRQPNVPFDSTGQHKVPVVFDTGRPNVPPYSRGQEKVPVDFGKEKVPIDSGTGQQKVPFDVTYDESEKTDVEYEEFEGLGRVPVDIPQETTTQRGYSPVYVHGTPNLGPTVYVRPHETLQPPHLPPENRTFYIRPTIPNIQTNPSRSGDSFPSYSHTNPTYSPHVPIYIPPEPAQNETRWYSTTTARTSIHVQKIPRKGTNSTIPNWPPPFPSTDISADYHFEEEGNTTPQPNMKVWKTSNFCGDDQFECGVRDCIPLNWVCNGQQVSKIQ